MKFKVTFKHLFVIPTSKVMCAENEQTLNHKLWLMGYRNYEVKRL